jgi:hypothetical protein
VAGVRVRGAMVAFAALLVAGAARGDDAGGKDVAAVVGTWRGESLCTVKPSACHDEEVVYHFARGGRPAAVTATANKIVDGAEVNMGTIECTVAAEVVTCPFEKGVFRFVIGGKQLTGTLTLTDGKLFRRIHATRR